jgi:YbgC/YbaW family acyl-CoA thioester hydrolase
MPHLTTIDVRFSELDLYGHVNHAVYLTYLEVARTEALASCDVPIDVMAERGYQVVVTAVDVRYRRSATMGDRLTVETAITGQRRASSTWSQRVVRGGELLAAAELSIAVTDRAGRPTRPPDWLFPALKPLLD